MMWTLSDSDNESGNENGEDEFNVLSDIILISSNEYSPNKKTSLKKEAKKDEFRSKIQEEKRKKQEEKQRKKQERRQKHDEKEKEKIKKKKEAEILKQLKPGECVKFITAVIDCNLISLKFGTDILSALQIATINYSVKQAPVSNTVTWTRKNEDSLEKEEDHIVFIWMFDELISHILTNNLKSRVQNFKNKYNNKTISIIVYGLEDYFKSQKTQKNRNLKKNMTIADSTSSKKQNEPEVSPSIELSRMDVEIALAEIQIFFHLQFRFVETGPELGLLIAQYCKAVAELPYKLQQKKKNESIDWYAAADSKDCVRVNSNGNGLLQVWQQQLCQFPNVGLDTVQAIISEYKSPVSLIRAYNNCESREDAELLLQNIPVRRSQGPLTTVRRIGPELSKKIYTFLNSTDGHMYLS